MKSKKWEQADLVRHARGTVSKSALSRWLGGSTPDLDGMVATCDTLGVSILDFLVAAGHVDPKEAGITVRLVNAAGLTKRELLDVLAERMPDDAAEVDGTIAPWVRDGPPQVEPRGVEGVDWAALDRRKM